MVANFSCSQLSTHFQRKPGKPLLSSLSVLLIDRDDLEPVVVGTQPNSLFFFWLHRVV